MSCGVLTFSPISSNPFGTRPAGYGIVNRHVDARRLRHPRRERAAPGRTQPQATGHAAAARRLQRPPGGRRRDPPTVRAPRPARSTRTCCPAPTRQRLRRLEAAPDCGRVLRRRARRATDRPTSQHRPDVGRRGNSCRAHRSVGPTGVHLAPARRCTPPREVRLRPPDSQDQPMGREELTLSTTGGQLWDRVHWAIADALANLHGGPCRFQLRCEPHPRGTPRRLPNRRRPPEGMGNGNGSARHHRQATRAHTRPGPLTQWSTARHAVRVTVQMRGLIPAAGRVNVTATSAGY